jgi:hypothetical protein
MSSVGMTENCGRVNTESSLVLALLFEEKVWNTLASVPSNYYSFGYRSESKYFLDPIESS